MSLKHSEQKREERTSKDDDSNEAHAALEGLSINDREFQEGQEPLYRSLLADEIRLLEVLPSLTDSEDEDVYCLLKYTSLSNPTSYDALSYTWGDPALPQVTINVNGHDLLVTENCKRALLMLRREVEIRGETETIWIDAICINQQDIAERSQQVPLMRDIYWNCQALIIWLGPEDEGTKEAIEIIASFDASVPASIHPTWGDEDETEGADKELSDWLAVFMRQPRIMERIFNFMRFFSLPWFRRVWVIQEFVVSRQKQQEKSTNTITMYCGQSRISPDALFKVYRRALPTMFSQLLKHGAAPPEFLDTTISKFDFLGRTRAMLAWTTRMKNGVADFKSGGAGLECFAGMYFQSSNLLPGTTLSGGAILISAIITSSSSFVTEPRDRVYGNMGMVMGLVQAATQHDESDNPEITDQPPQASENDGPLSDLIFDYSRSVEDIYSSAVRFVVNTSHRLDILSLCTTRSDLVSRTWTPDFSCLKVWPSVSHQATSPPADRDLVTTLMDAKDSIGENPTPPSTGLCAQSLYYRVRSPTLRVSGNSAAIASFSDDLSVLSVEGFCIAFIDETFGHHTSRKPTTENQAPRYDLSNRESLTALMDMLVAKGCYKSHELARKGIWNTLVGEVSPDTKDADTDWERHIETWPSWVGQMTAQNITETQPARDWWNGIVTKERNRDLLFAQPLLGDKFPEYLFGKCFDWVEVGDLVVVVMGCDVPMVIRPVDDYYEIVGDCFVDGLMEGQAMELLESGEAELMMFDLH